MHHYTLYMVILATVIFVVFVVEINIQYNEIVNFVGKKRDSIMREFHFPESLHRAYLPVQFVVLQDCVSCPAPVQSIPLYCGAGLVQLRVRVDVPTPHVVVHALHVSQFVHEPSTKRERITAIGFASAYIFWHFRM